MGGTKFIFHMVEWQGSCWTPYHSEVKKEMHQVLSERSDPLLAVFGKLLRKKTFT